MRDGVAGRGGTIRADVWIPTAPAVTLLLLNVVDGLFTLVFLQLGVAQEANPLMRAAYEASPFGFMAVKLLIVNAGVLVLCWYRENKVAQWALKAATGLYAAIVIWHLSFLTWLVVD